MIGSNQKKEIQINQYCKTTSVIDGLAVYKIGEGEPSLLFPYPHGATLTSISESLLCRLLISIGRTVITFDPPQAYASKRKSDYTLKEILECGEEALNYFGIKEPVDVVGHSMGGFCAIAFTFEKRVRVKSLLVICGNPGFSEVSDQWFNSKIIKATDFIKLTYYGFKEICGLGSLKNHKKMNNLLDYHLFEDKKYFSPRIVYKGDWRCSAPARDRWMNTVRKENYNEHLSKINVPVLIISGRNDILSSEEVNENMHRKFDGSIMEYFDKSRHFPFVEEEDKFISVVTNFWKEC